MPDSVRQHRTYLRDGATWRELWPLLLYDEEHEALLCFNGFGRRAQVLDYVSGRTLEGTRLEEAFPGAEAALAARLATGAAPAPVVEAPRDGNRFGDFTVLARLGRGAMGVVCLARQGCRVSRPPGEPRPSRGAQAAAARAGARRRGARALPAGDRGTLALRAPQCRQDLHGR